MSAVTKAISLAKKFKHKYEAQIKARTPVYLSPVRRIERVALNERVCAMTFDDGPFALPTRPADDERPLTTVLVETLEKYGAKGTFDIIGDTSTNYPDCAGKEGSALWGGKAYDHYPDINQDAYAGAKNCPELIRRILEGGHEITNHTYAHIIYGKKPMVYGSRKYMGNMDAVVDDLKKLHDLMEQEHGYTMKLSRPPHYVDPICNDLTSYDAYAVMGYQYMAASFDGAGWLPLATYEEEVNATYLPLQAALEANPDALCGQIIFQKDGYNMARRTPVAHGLEKQLELLTKYGYRVVSVSDLMEQAAFADLAPDAPEYPAVKALVDGGYCPIFRDNTVRLHQPMTRGELAMVVFGRDALNEKIARHLAKGKSYYKDVPATHPYGAAISMAMSKSLFAEGNIFRPDDALTMDEFAFFMKSRFGETVCLPKELTRASVLCALSDALFGA